MTAIARMGPDDWRRVRAVRLRSLRDAPDAFFTTVEQDEARPPEVWRERLASPAAATFLASEDGADLGLAFGAPYTGHPDAQSRAASSGPAIESASDRMRLAMRSGASPVS